MSMPGIVIARTESVCPVCLRRIPAERQRVGDDVYLCKTCPDHGEFRTIVWRGTPYSEGWVHLKSPSFPENPFTPVSEGCPYDCGLCARHRQHTCTALLEVTQRCNLRCPVCFASAGEYTVPDPDMAAIRFWYQRLLDAGGPYNVQLSGGEPTVRDDLPEIIAIGRAMGFGFIQVNTNGVRLAEDFAYFQSLKEAGLASLFLQFDGTEPDIFTALRGRDLWQIKARAIANAERLGIGVVLVPTLVPGVNDHNIGAIIDFALQHTPTIRGVHFQPVSYIGRYPETPADASRITIPEVIRALESQTGGRLKVTDFSPPGCENPLCSFHAYYTLDGGGNLLLQGSGKTCCGTEIAAENAAKVRSFVATSWISAEDAIPVLDDFDRLLLSVKRHSFFVSGMAFQDAWTLDMEQLRDCCIHVVHPDGRLIPFCAYNLTNQQGMYLHRGQDAPHAP